MTLTEERPPPTDPPWDEPDYDNALPTPALSNGTAPPQDMAAEQSVLGAMLISPATITDVTPELEPGDFYRPAHEAIYDAITALHARGEPVDMVTVADELARHPAGPRGRTQLQAIGGAPYLHTLANGVPVAGNATHYARIIRDHARARTIITTGQRLTQLGHNATPDRIDLALSDALQALDDTVQRFGPRTDHTHRAGLHDLSWVGTGQEPRQPPPTYVRRTDGTALFYEGKVNGIFGDPEHGKSWAAQLAVVQALDEGNTAAIIDVDHNGPQATAGRLFLLGAQLDTIADPDRFRYYEPEDGEELLNAVTDITNRRMNVVVLDSLGEIFPMLGVKTNDGDEITTAMRQVLTRPALAGSCVITIDHLPKATEARSTGFAIGSIAKKRMIRGAYLRAEAKVKPAPGAVGRIALRIEKDSTGELRRSSGGGYAGTLILDSTDERYLTWRIGRDTVPKNDDGTWRPTTVMELVAKYIEAHPACTGRDIETDVPGKGSTIRAALTNLTNEGFVRREPGPRRSFFHYSEIPYREAEDDQANPTN